jgi:hypothetical protein
MVPQEHRGILFPVGISSTHVAMCTVRMEPVWSSLGQAAGVAAGLAIEADLDLCDVPVDRIQDELLNQRCVLFFYTDVPGDDQGFKAIQALSVRGAIDLSDRQKFQPDRPAMGLTDLNKDAYRFRPDDPITLGEFARMAVKGLHIPLSITASHFRDVPRAQAAFKYIETLYDYSTQSHTPFFDYEIRKESGRTSVFANPEQEVSPAKAAKLIGGLLGKVLSESVGSDSSLTRRQAAQLVYQHSKSVR